MEEVLVCPNCNNADFEPFLNCIDYTVTKEQFTIKNCKNCGFKLTSPRPTAAEIGKYYDSEDYISHSNTSAGLINKIYHLVKRRAIQQKIHLIEGLNPHSKNILDIGCGAGSFLKEISEAGWNAKGVEPSEKIRNFCKNDLRLEVYDENYLEKTADRFSVITMWHVLEHVHGLNQRIDEIYRLLTPGGYAVIAVPNYQSADAKKYKEYWAAFDVPRHLYHFSSDIIKSLFQKHKLHFIKSIPMKMDSFYVSMLSEKYMQSSLQMPKAFITGLTSNLKAGSNAEKYSSVIYIFSKLE
jgi:2-polyprenyl-3-methyl-5-hydroxy-6-metoxy-1,4-benzoquinol methylase